MSDIKEKIDKLLNLSQSSNPHEAALALGKAHELMKEHGFEAAAFECREYVKNSDLNLRAAYKKGKTAPHENELLSIIMYAFGVFVYHSASIKINPLTGRKNVFKAEYVIFGKPHRVRWAEYAMDMILRTVEAERKSFIANMRVKARRKGRGPLPGSLLREAADNFCLGFMIEIREKVKHLFPGNKEESIAVEENFTKSYKSKIPALKVNKLEQLREAKDLGRQKGANFEIFRPMEGDAAPLLLSDKR